MGAIIGIERDLHKRPAGVRTSMFICLGSTLFTVLSVELAKACGDTTHVQIASNIVQGIGFLGAGAILRDRAGIVVGMTTAAVIFVEAAIGMAIGGGLYALGATTTGIVLFGLIILFWGEEKLNLNGHKIANSHKEDICQS
jgi:putative Mg2+ transporter-C (MgtC) family protein